MVELNGAVILVIGINGGLGSRFAEQLRDRGATVVGSARSAAADGVIATDIRDPEAPARLIESVLAEHDRLDGIVVAAGVVAFGAATELADDTLSELFDVNAFGPIRVIRAAIPALTASAESGRTPFVITLSGVVSEAPTAGLAAYSASKSALAAFTVAATRELRKAGIRVIDARPGHIETGLADHPIAGTAPKFPTGLAPEAVVARIIAAIVDDERDLPSAQFS